ncbi:hypothetical protein BDN70DRAFT_777548, partial [Pholiota conissans]
GWAFTLRKICRLLGRQFGIGEREIMIKLREENYFNPRTRKWGHIGVDEHNTHCLRGFTTFTLELIVNIFRSSRNRQHQPAMSMWIQQMERLGITLSDFEYALDDDALIQVIMFKYLPGYESIMETIVMNVALLPHPLS